MPLQRRFSLLDTRNPFAFPFGRRAAFDPAHPASRNRAPGPTISVVAGNGNFRNLASGVSGVLTGAPTTVIDGRIGIGLQFSGTQVSTFTVAEGAAAAPFTMAAIFVSNNPSTAGIMVSSGGGFIRINSGVFETRVNTSANAAQTTVTGHAYFGGFSTNGINSGGKYSEVLVDLTTGQTFYQFAANGAASAASTSITFGSAAGSSPATGPMAAAMYSNALLSLGEMLEWAADPWSFWYPRDPLSYVGVRTAINIPKTTHFKNLIGCGI